MKASAFARPSTRTSMLQDFATFFACRLIDVSTFWGAFLYVFVTFTCKSLYYIYIYIYIYYLYDYFIKKQEEQNNRVL